MGQLPPKSFGETPLPPSLYFLSLPFTKEEKEEEEVAGEGGPKSKEEKEIES